MFSVMKVAIIHYWLLSMRGGEKVVEALCELFPNADIYTHVCDRANLSAIIDAHPIYTTFIDSLPFARKLYKRYLPLMPFALEQLDLTHYDLVLSSESGPSKAVITGPHALHICYCHSPMRYVWDQYHIYREGAGVLTRIFMSIISPFLRIWDTASATRVDHFVANSQFVAMRIRKFYGRRASVIYPPVAVERFDICTGRGDYYLCAGQLVRYKRIDLAIQAFLNTGRRLLIAGTGEEEERLKAMGGSNIEFVGRQTDRELASLLQGCRALVFPGMEDFGIVPIEAMACGRPVIAYGAGGALETVIDRQTGILFPEQSWQSLRAAVETFEQLEHEFDPVRIRQHATLFDAAIFKKRFEMLVHEQFEALNEQFGATVTSLRRRTE
jgi:glycosyltransferase involved in cell wall biosynthesis